MDARQEPGVATLHPQIYQRLRELARSQLRGESPTQSLDTTSLVHETWPGVTGYSPTLRIFTPMPPLPCGTFWSITPGIG